MTNNNVIETALNELLTTQRKIAEQNAKSPFADLIGKFVLVRSRDSGCHTGYLHSANAFTVVLTEARRLIRWRDVPTLSEVALRGVPQEHSRISEPVAQFMVIGGCEITPCTPEATANLRRSRWSN